MPLNTNEKPDKKPANARRVAIRALGRVLDKEELLENAILADSEFSALEGRDRAFVRLLVSSYFRYAAQIDNVIRKFVSRTPPAYVQNILRLGAVQALILKTAEHAVVSESVELAKSHKKYQKFSGLINAVLRKVITQGGSHMATMAPRDNIPTWIYRGWEKAYGRGDARQMALQLQKIPPLDINVKSDAEKWAELLGGELLPGQIIRLEKAGQVRELPGYESGEWWVQDLSSSLAVALLDDIVGPMNGLKVLDMCAAPGGKTLQLASRGANVTALDKSETRSKILQQNLERTDLSAKVEITDARHWDEDREFDIIILDAPCSAIGTYRRHPDVLYRKSPKQLTQLIKLQQELLLSAVEKLRPGGVLVYCTCSLQVEEGEHQVDKFVSENKAFEVIRPSGEIWRQFGKESGYLRLLPHYLREKGGLDGFFIACLRKKIEQM